jgi:hypothetical protein
MAYGLRAFQRILVFNSPALVDSVSVGVGNSLCGARSIPLIAAQPIHVHRLRLSGPCPSSFKERTTFRLTQRRQHHSTSCEIEQHGNEREHPARWPKQAIKQNPEDDVDPAGSSDWLPGTQTGKWKFAPDFGVWSKKRVRPKCADPNIENVVMGRSLVPTSRGVKHSLTVSPWNKGRASSGDGGTKLPLQRGRPIRAAASPFLQAVRLGLYI